MRGKDIFPCRPQKGLPIMKDTGFSDLSLDGNWTLTGIAPDGKQTISRTGRVPGVLRLFLPARDPL